MMDGNPYFEVMVNGNAHGISWVGLMCCKTSVRTSVFQHANVLSRNALVLQRYADLRATGIGWFVRSPGAPGHGELLRRQATRVDDRKSRPLIWSTGLPRNAVRPACRRRHSGFSQQHKYTQICLFATLWRRYVHLRVRALES